ncbi:hypothetical protein POM88_008631 [Heracleum sosnowskyi]|uniref:Reverse transcriptase zinc-binding domain-containing protein n=1 Tax=Heracleum sosnowskyi TaxID=360622 RepID=A0AAD8J7J5_9APIA|nr:hypothetical protein POM88_008631 [Heracleum sosnowskyi]
MRSGVRQKFESIRRSFLWGEYDDNGSRRRKMHMLSWDKLILPRNAGGWVLAPSSQKTILYWANGGLNGCWTKNLPETVLNGIISINNAEGFSSVLSFNNFKWVLKDGNSVLFWEDVWLGSGELYKSFSRLFQLSKLHNVTVKHFVDTWSDPNTDSSTLWSR